MYGTQPLGVAPQTDLGLYDALYTDRPRGLCHHCIDSLCCWCLAYRCKPAPHKHTITNVYKVCKEYTREEGAALQVPNPPLPSLFLRLSTRSKLLTLVQGCTVHAQPGLYQISPARLLPAVDENPTRRACAAETNKWSSSPMLGIPHLLTKKPTSAHKQIPTPGVAPCCAAHSLRRASGEAGLLRWLWGQAWMCWSLRCTCNWCTQRR
jgi:hypothetical protein